MSAMIDAVNLRTMNSKQAVADYAFDETLTPAEQAILDRVVTEVRGKPILDIGVGGGRTVKPLLEVSDDYLGIDYSLAMLAVVRQRYPDVRLEHADARDLSQVPAGSIFLAMFSMNGISMAGHEDRLLILKEIYRVLQPGGVFLFSTYNQSSRAHDAGFRFPGFNLSKNPVRLLVRSARFARSTALRLVNRRRFKRHEVRTTDYSVINDRCHDYATMLYYIGLEAQRRQLEEAGFDENAEAYDLKGDLIEGTTTHDSMALIARKPAL